MVTWEIVNSVLLTTGIMLFFFFFFFFLPYICDAYFKIPPFWGYFLYSVDLSSNYSRVSRHGAFTQNAQCHRITVAKRYNKKDL